MKKAYFYFSAIGTAVSIVLLAGCNQLGQNANQTQALPATPKEVTQTFYAWYLGLDANPIESGSYRTSPLLTDQLKQNLADTIAGFQQGGYDPIVCAQDQPQTFRTLEPQLNQGQAVIDVVLEFGGNQTTIPVTLVQDQTNQWLIDQIDCDQTQANNNTGPTKQAILYFANPTRAPDTTECGLVYGVERVVPRTDNQEEQLELVLNQLFAGPTTTEQQQGYSSFFDTNTKAILNRVVIEGNTAYVDIADIRQLIPNASSSCGSQDLIAAITETVKHERQVQDVIIAINGDPATFYNWVQLGCQPANNNCDPGPLAE